jgi:hypothetical protein
MDCCLVNEQRSSGCIRKRDGKYFSLPRKFSRKSCKNPRGFTMKSSCAPFVGCYRKNKSIKGKVKGYEIRNNQRKRLREKQRKTKKKILKMDF